MCDTLQIPKDIVFDEKDNLVFSDEKTKLRNSKSNDLEFEEPKCPSTPIKRKDNIDIWSLVSNIDEDGNNLEWMAIIDYLNENGNVSKGLEMIYDFYQNKNPNMGSWMNYLLACSHFSEEELGLPCNRYGRKALERKCAKLIKARKADPHSNINQFMYNNQNIKY
jgi:hypothetical protein